MEGEEYLDSRWMLAQYMRDIAQFSLVVQDHIAQNTMSERGLGMVAERKRCQTLNNKQNNMVNRGSPFTLTEKS